ncbi:MAG: hypothetical protein ACKVT0_11125 [Planctomycetaceae bacterium]
MSRLFVGNFDFEHHLARDQSFTLSERLKRLHAELATLWYAVAETGDAIWLPMPVDFDFSSVMQSRGFPKVEMMTSRSEIPAGVELCPWGWTSQIRRWGETNRCVVHSPDPAAVRVVNSRHFSWQCERDWGVQISNAAELQTVNEVQSHLLRASRRESRWVIKAEFGMSARERILGQGVELAKPDIRWMQNRLSVGSRLYFEPWVEKSAEVGMQFSIPDVGSPRLEGCTELLTDPCGQYLGSRWTDRIDQEWADEIVWGYRVADEVQRAGYFGPLGIDAMRYRDENGSIRSRPIQDINARWTMGRLALACRRYVPAENCFSWLHVTRPSEPEFLKSMDVREFSPKMLIADDAHGVPVQRQVYLVSAGSKAELLDRESSLLQSEKSSS